MCEDEETTREARGWWEGPEAQRLAVGKCPKGLAVGRKDQRDSSWGKAEGGFKLGAARPGPATTELNIVYLYSPYVTTSSPKSPISDYALPGECEEAGQRLH